MYYGLNFGQNKRIVEVMANEVGLILSTTSRCQTAAAAKGGGGANSNVKTMAILTGELLRNDDHAGGDSTANDQKQEYLRKDLRRRHFTRYLVKGHCEGDENSYLIYNISRQTALYLGHKHCQEAIVFIDGSHCEYLVRNGDGEYVMTQEREMDKRLDMSDAAEYFTQVSRAFDLQVPFFDGSDENRREMEASSRYVNEMINKRMKELLFEEVLNFNSVISSGNALDDSSIYRMLRWLNSKDCAFITGFADSPKDNMIENGEKDRFVTAQLLVYGYAVVKIKGRSSGDKAEENSEIGYFVVNWKEGGAFLENILRTSDYFGLGPVYYKEAWATEARLIDTQDKGEGRVSETGSAHNSMADTAGKALSFITTDAEKASDSEAAKGGIAMEGGANDEYVQMRKEQLGEAAEFWRSIVYDRMQRIEDMEMRSRYVMHSALRRYKERHPSK